jgi:menaquinone-dependent protoporphyrinogen IX oxidase
MRVLVLYATRHGTTRRVAEAIADGIRTVAPAEVRAVAAVDTSLEPAELVVVGGPTEAHRITADMLDFLQTLSPEAVRDRRAAAFDTRLRMPQWLAGSAAQTIGRKLERLGARAPVPTESFFVSPEPDISPEELERAGAWGRTLAEQALGGLATTTTATGAA